MAESRVNHNQDRIVLRNGLSDVAQIPVWVESLFSRHSIPHDLRFAVDLCLEEAVTNIIRHGYAGATDFPVTIGFTAPRKDYFVFVIEDEAPAFNWMDAPESPKLGPADGVWIGGQGVRLLRGFASGLEYAPMPNGNRLRIGFSAQSLPAGAK